MARKKPSLGLRRRSRVPDWRIEVPDPKAGGMAYKEYTLHDPIAGEMKSVLRKRGEVNFFPIKITKDGENATFILSHDSPLEGFVIAYSDGPEMNLYDADSNAWSVRRRNRR